MGKGHRVELLKPQKVKSGRCTKKGGFSLGTLVQGWKVVWLDFFLESDPTSRTLDLPSLLHLLSLGSCTLQQLSTFESTTMLHLRRSALRVLSSQPSSFLSKPRSIASLQTLSARSKPATSTISFQRRWATGEAEAKREDEEVPISEIQPTPQEDVENAIQEDNAATAETASASGESAPVVDQASAAEDTPIAETANATEATNEAIPESETSPIDTSAQSVAQAASNIAGAAAGAASGAARDASPRAYEGGRNRSEMIAEPKETIYIGNLFFDVTENDLKKELSRFGNVVSCRLLRDSRGLSKGFGYVDFETVEAATAAINALNQQVFEGRRLTVQYAAFNSKSIQNKRTFERSDRPLNPPSKTLFIGNMSFEMTDRDLTNLFRGIRNVIDVRVAIDRRTGQPRGFAHADFLDIKSAMDAMKVLGEKESYGRRLRIDYSYGSSSAPKNQAPPER